MAKKNTVALVIVAVVCAAAGFFIGQVVNASFNSPGSANDPLVSQSYVETVVGERTAQLQTQIEELQNQVTALGGGTVSTSNNTSSSSTTSGTNSTTTNTATTTTDTTNTANTTETSGKTVTVSGNSVNVRSEANTSASVVSQVSKGDKLTVVSEDGDWYQVKLSDGSEGWIASWLVQ